jgi:hypothetical protein
VRHLQAAVIVLSATLVLLLATLAVHQRRSALRMRYLALTDELTNVPNRRSVLSRLDPLLRDPEAGLVRHAHHRYRSLQEDQRPIRASRPAMRS